VKKSSVACPITEEFKRANTGTFDALHHMLSQPSLKTFEAFWMLATSVYGVSHDVAINFLNVDWQDISIVAHLPNIEEVDDDDEKTYKDVIGFRRLCGDILENKRDGARVHLMKKNPSDEIPVICCDICDLQDLMFDLVDGHQPENQDELREHIGCAKALSERAIIMQENPRFRMH